MKSQVILSVAFALAMAACKRTADLPIGEQPGTSGPVETSPPNTDYRPAFAGQTRANGAVTATKYKATVLTSVLTSPWGVKTLPDGRFLITQRTGAMRIVSATGTPGPAFTGVPAVNSGGQGGLLGLCLDPDFATNKMIYWSFSEAVTGGNVTAIAKGRLSANEQALENVTVIYRATPAYAGTLHYGGRVVFDRTGNLLISTGERSDLVTRPQAQDYNSSLGKIIRITTNGQPAPGNPFLTRANTKPELFSVGHRNPQGLAIHPVTGELWQGEHGPRGGDEINHVTAGLNYGWPTITYGIEYTGPAIGAGIQQQEGLEQPVYYWDPVVSPSGMTFYSGNRIPEWQNNLFIGALSGQHIVRLVFSNKRVVGEERLLASEGQRFRDITQGSDGALYAVTDAGRLYKIDRE
jgi:glucose/arabinose dehydrogenase